MNLHSEIIVEFLHTANIVNHFLVKHSDDNFLKVLTVFTQIFELCLAYNNESPQTGVFKYD